MQIGSQSCDHLSFTSNSGLPSITGINVKAAFSRTSTPVHSALINFPRFLCSRTLKRRHSLHRRSDETSQSQATLLPSKLLDREMGSRLALKLLVKKSTPADLIRLEKLQQKDKATVTESRDESVAKWLAQRKASQTISLKQKSRKVKIVVSLPKARRKDGSSELLGTTLALLRFSEDGKLNWREPLPLQAWGHETRQSEPRHFFKLALK